MSQIHFQTNSEIGDSQSIVRNQLTIGQSRKRKSVAWNHFDEVGEKAVCKHCRKELTISPVIGTTHLKRHNKKTCKKIDEEERVLFTSGQKDDLLPPAKFDFELTRDLMTMLFIDAEIPFSVIESQFWEPAMRSLRPEYRAVGRQTLRNDCVRVFKAGSGILMEEFEALDSHISITSDIWTSSVSLGYMCVTAHYIDKSFNIHKKIISFNQVSYPHSGPGIASAIKKTIFDWKLDQKVFAITLDNCLANNNAMSFLDNILWDKSVFDGENMHMRCGSHILNIMVQDGMETLRVALSKIREMMRYITSSGQRLQNFNDILETMHLSSKRELILDCVTRWNSTHEMVCEALKYKDALIMYADGSPIELSNLEE